MPNGTYGGVRGRETKVGQKTFVSRPTRLDLKNKGAATQAPRPYHYQETLLLLDDEFFYV